jgi:pSer/pThr/pTyr-binding forkhead associated (FHA) protein
MVADEALMAEKATAEQDVEIVLKPISHPALGDIRIDENLFAIGRTEAPFASYEQDIVAELSRRHARIFSENGAVYIADLDSKNGTTLNGVSVRQQPVSLHHGDEIRFGDALSYRVELRARADKPRRAAKLLSLTLMPERPDLGLQPIVVTRFPFLVSKTDDVFSRYKDEHPHQLNYVSRRHAHIFLKGGAPFIEDLGSTNGTFVADTRLNEHAVPLEDGDVLAFGGNHFVYKVSLHTGIEIDPTLTKLAAVAPSASAAEASSNADKTTFVAAANSFLDIFCVDHAPQQEDEVNNEVLQHADGAAKGAGRHRARGKAAIFLSELTESFAGSDRISMKRALRWTLPLAALLAGLAFMLYHSGAPERELKGLLASGDYANAATDADRHLARDPDNAEIKTLGTEALLKANVPKWLAMLKARQFDRAAAVLADMKKIGSHNADVAPLLNELEWIGNLEKFVAGRGGAEAPIRIYADEEKIKGLLKQWDESAKGHQMAFAAISAAVPEFKDPYAEALSHLRTLKSDDAVYLAAIERLKATIHNELNQDRAESLEPILKEYAEKYPRIGGLEAVRQDLRQYVEVDNAARARKLGPLIALLAKVKFSTPPFQEKFRALAASRLPPADVVQQYQANAKAWREGDTKQAFAGLQKMAVGPWADAASSQLAHRKAIVDQFAALQAARGAKGYDERLLSFSGSLDPDEDVYFIRATEADVGLIKDQALKRAQELLNRAQTQWRQYRESGSIEGAQRYEAAISNQFRTQARLLSNARDDAQQGMRIYKQLKADAAQWRKVQDEINAEMDLQRKSLQELRTVLEPGLLKAKLALIGGRNGDER